MTEQQKINKEWEMLVTENTNAKWEKYIHGGESPEDKTIHIFPNVRMQLSAETTLVCWLTEKGIEHKKVNGIIVAYVYSDEKPLLYDLDKVFPSYEMDTFFCRSLDMTVEMLQREMDAATICGDKNPKKVLEKMIFERIQKIEIERCNQTHLWEDRKLDRIYEECMPLVDPLEDFWEHMYER